MGYYLGRALQLIAIIQLGYALYTGFILGDSRTELLILAAAAIMFIAGRAIERRSARS